MNPQYRVHAAPFVINTVDISETEAEEVAEDQTSQFESPKNYPLDG